MSNRFPIRASREEERIMMEAASKGADGSAFAALSDRLQPALEVFSAHHPEREMVDAFSEYLSMSVMTHGAHLATGRHILEVDSRAYARLNAADQLWIDEERLKKSPICGRCIAVKLDKPIPLVNPRVLHNNVAFHGDGGQEGLVLLGGYMIVRMDRDNEERGHAPRVAVMVIEMVELEQQARGLVLSPTMEIPAGGAHSAIVFAPRIDDPPIPAEDRKFFWWNLAAALLDVRLGAVHVARSTYTDLQIVKEKKVRVQRSVLRLGDPQNHVLKDRVVRVPPTETLEVPARASVELGTPCFRHVPSHRVTRWVKELGQGEEALDIREGKNGVVLMKVARTRAGYAYGDETVERKTRVVTVLKGA